MPLTKTIAPNDLRELMIANPNTSDAGLARLLGVGFSTFYAKRRKDPALAAVYAELRGNKLSARAPRRGSSKRGASTARNSNKQRVSDELLRRLKHEFEHIDLYGNCTENFEELRGRLNAIK